LTEVTHVAVALCVASGLADAGVGVEAAALEFGLHFEPLVEENYFLACLKANLRDPAVQRLCAALAGAGWRDILANLAGYRPAIAPGKVLVMTDALPWWPKIKSKPKPVKTRAPTAARAAPPTGVPAPTGMSLGTPGKTPLPAQLA
jgi:hypothetical protein